MPAIFLGTNADEEAASSEVPVHAVKAEHANGVPGQVANDEQPGGLIGAVLPKPALYFIHGHPLARVCVQIKPHIGVVFPFPNLLEVFRLDLPHHHQLADHCRQHSSLVPTLLEGDCPAESIV